MATLLTKLGELLEKKFLRSELYKSTEGPFIEIYGLQLNLSIT